MPKQKILIVDDEKGVRWTLAEALRMWGYLSADADTAAAALFAFDNEQPAAVLLDVHLPDGLGLDVLREIKQRQPDAVVIMMTGDVMVEDTIAALRGGAYDFIGKPINLEELQVTIRNGIEAQSLRKEVNQFRRERAGQFTFDQIIGDSPGMAQMFALARKVAESEVSAVLLQGESGTGKDLVAKAIHYSSRRSEEPFVAINCAAIPATLIESELFGYEKGAFTDAKARKEGLFEQAQGGTLFLDEIGELELSLQAKLLRVLEEAAFRRVGGLKDIPLDVRVIAASNRDLKGESALGRFRLDLYYRLSVIQIDIPPLSGRADDVVKLAEHYIAYFNERLRKRVRGLSPEVVEIFRRYSWPGNVRELRNVIERVMILEDGELITSAYLPGDLAKGDGSAARAEGSEQAQSFLSGVVLPPEGIVLDDVEMSLVSQALERSGGNQTHAAQLLGISRDQLRYRLKKLQETAPTRESSGSD
ncbi:MAG TPA: sigma-54 dependent transcriptional regulator [Blastocatellia bacterium]|jgi:DNA-binding NtrC family response regulator|nr:sigma-54 dependent transcriptional regulator [Blastocatellia bacterium]